MSSEAWLIVGFAEGVFCMMMAFVFVAVALPRIETWARKLERDRDEEGEL